MNGLAVHVVCCQECIDRLYAGQPLFFAGEDCLVPQTEHDLRRVTVTILPPDPEWWELRRDGELTPDEKAACAGAWVIYASDYESVCDGVPATVRNNR